MKKRIKHLQDRGQNLVEITLLLPLLMLIFTGMVETGWWIHSYVTVATAAREGSRYGSRGLHLPPDEIAEVTSVALASNLEVSYSGEDANATIIVTEIDIDHDGSYHVANSYIYGTLPVTSKVCLLRPCADDAVDLQTFRDENVAFNSNPELCQESFGCRNDFVIVEIFFQHDLVMASAFSEPFFPDPININARSVMRVLFRRSPWN